MLFPWTDPRCIICLRERQLTEEHIIPRVIGGTLKARFLCADCNSSFGTRYDARLRFDRLVRETAISLRSTLPDLVEAMEQGTAYVGRANGQEFEGVIRSGVFRPRAQGLGGAPLILPEEHARASIEADLTRSGRGSEVSSTLSRLANAQPNELTSIAPGFEIVNLEFDALRPLIDMEDQVHEMWAVKTSYEFLACRMGPAIYHAALQPVRDLLIGGGRDEVVVRVERLESERTDPMHGLLQEVNAPHASVQVRLFRRACYRTHFNRVSFNGSRAFYQQTLTPHGEVFGLLD